MNNIGNNNIIHKNEDRRHKKEEINDTNYNNKVDNKLKIENNNNDNIKSETSKKEIVITEITNPKLKRSFDSGNNNHTSYKKPIQKYTNKNTTISKPKKEGGGIIKGRSQEKVKKVFNRVVDNHLLNNNEDNIRSDKKLVIKLHICGKNPK